MPLRRLTCKFAVVSCFSLETSASFVFCSFTKQVRSLIREEDSFSFRCAQTRAYLLFANSVATFSKPSLTYVSKLYYK